MAQLNAAYRVLSNPQRRQAHDQELMVDLADLDDSYAEWMQAFVHARRHGD
jgi:curved DNA-binding protein CbpA